MSPDGDDDLVIERAGRAWRSRIRDQLSHRPGDRWSLDETHVKVRRPFAGQRAVQGAVVTKSAAVTGTVARGPVTSPTRTVQRLLVLSMPPVGEF